MKFFRTQMPLILVALAFIWSAVTIAVRRSEEAPPGTKVIRIGHWQLEAGVREAFETLGKQFAELPEIKAKYGNVMVVQDAIPGPTYGQWMTSQMMGKTAPDLLEMGQLPDPILLSYESRYFFPLTDMASAPNPFNRGTPMENVALKETFLDGMRTGYQVELQAYMRVPLSRLTSRVFYNRTLLRKLTGLSEPPRDLQAFLKLCEKIRTIPLPPPRQDQHYSAIAASEWHTTHWYQNVTEPLTYATIFVADFSRDGAVGSDETFAAIVSGRMHLSDAPWRANFEITRQLTEQFNQGFAGLGRDEALFLFAQQKAVFISTGIWDVGSLQDQAAGKFEVGIADFPRPGKDDTKYPQLALGPIFDPAWAQFPFGVYRLSKNPDLAKDFLLYLASTKGNEQLNRIIGWIPSIAGVPIPPALAKFAPADTGVYDTGSLTLGGNTVVAYNQRFSEFQTNPDYSFEQFQKDFLPVYRSQGRRDLAEQQRDWRRGILNNDKVLAGLRGEALLNAPANAEDQRWVKYRAFTTGTNVLPEYLYSVQQEIVDRGPDRPVGPYDYLPEAIARARREIGTGGAAGAATTGETPARGPGLNKAAGGAR